MESSQKLIFCQDSSPNREFFQIFNSINSESYQPYQRMTNESRGYWKVPPKHIAERHQIWWILRLANLCIILKHKPRCLDSKYFTHSELPHTIQFAQRSPIAPGSEI